MWLVIQIAFCVIFVGIVCFWAGRKIGRRHYLKLQEEMRALEKGFNQLLEEMEMVSNHNVKVLEAQTSDLRELLTVADKKCIYASDLIKNLDESAEQLKKRNLSVGTISNKPSELDEEFKKEVKEAVEIMYKRLLAVEEKHTALVTQQEEIKKDFEAKLSEIVKQNIQSQAQDSVEKSDEIIEDHFQESAEIQQQEATLDRLSQMAEKLMQDFEETIAPEVKEEAPPIPRKTLDRLKAQNASGSDFGLGGIYEEIRLPKRVVAESKRSAAKNPLPNQPMGSLVYEVTKLAQEGVTIPQIARKLNLGKGQVGLIIKMYGSKTNARKVI